VRVGGGWGFAATAGRRSPRGAEAALTRALAIAEAQPVGAERPLAGARRARPRSLGVPVRAGPLRDRARRQARPAAAADAALRADPRISVALSSLGARRASTRRFASTDGAACTQRVVQCGGGVHALAVDPNDGRGPGALLPHLHGGRRAQAGWEHVLGLDLAGQAARSAARPSSC